jgi:hypothetical protein
MDMGETRWIRDDGVGDKVVFDTRAPTSFNHFVHHLATTWDFAALEGFEARY